MEVTRITPPLVFQFLQVWFRFIWFGACLVLAAEPVETAEVMTRVLAHQYFFHTGITVPEAPLPTSSSWFCSRRSQCIEISAGWFPFSHGFPEEGTTAGPPIYQHFRPPWCILPYHCDLDQSSENSRDVLTPAPCDVWTALNIHPRWSECTVNSEILDLQHKLPCKQGSSM